MRVLVACEYTGVVRRAFREAGHDAYSCDLLPALDGQEKYHLKMDAVVAAYQGNWDLMIAHPPCTYLSNSGWHWTVRELREGVEDRWKKAELALQFFMELWTAPIPRIAMENPTPGPLLGRTLKYDQAIQPYMFSENASKRTCLWLRGLTPLVVPDSSEWVQPRIVNNKKRWDNQTDGGQNKLGPSPERGLLRSATYPGIARAFVENWGTTK